MIQKAIVKEMNPLLVPLHLGWSREVTLKKPSGQVETPFLLTVGFASNINLLS